MGPARSARDCICSRLQNPQKAAKPAAWPPCQGHFLAVQEAGRRNTKQLKDGRARLQALPQPASRHGSRAEGAISSNPNCRMVQRSQEPRPRTSTGLAREGPGGCFTECMSSTAFSTEEDVGIGEALCIDWAFVKPGQSSVPAASRSS